MTMTEDLPRLSPREVAARCKGAKAAGANRWSAQCPAHDDNVASLSIGQGDDGRVLLWCHAGCAFEAIVAALGIQRFQLSSTRQRPNPLGSADVHPELGPIQATYDYVNAEGKLLYQVCRFEPKTFRPRRRNSIGAWEWKKGVGPDVPFHLLELLEAVASERTIYIPEGERDVLSLERLGLSATCNSGGAEKWSDDLSPHLRGAIVVILPDHDEPGRRHAQAVARSLTGHAASIKLLELPGLGHKEDVSDWIERGGTRDQLEEMVSRTPLLGHGSVKAAVIATTNDVPDFDALAEEQTARAFQRLDEDTTRFPRLLLPSLHDLAGFLAPDELWIWLARQSNGKSLAMQNIAHGFVEQGIPGLYIGTEQDADRLRIKQACVKAGVNPRFVLKPSDEDRASPRYAESVRAVKAGLEWLNSPPIKKLLTFANTRYVNRAELARWVTGAVTKRGARWIIVDHLDHMDHGEGRNSAQELKDTVQLAKDLACTHQLSMLCASQVRRAGDPMQNFMPPTVDGGFGSSAKEHTADVILGGWRPLRDDLPVKQLREMRKRAAAGQVAEADVYQRNIMGVRLLKDRLGDAPGKQTYLVVEHGRLLEMPKRDRYTTSAFSGARI